MILLVTGLCLCCCSSIWVHIVFLCTPFFGVRVLHLGHPLATHVHLYFSGCLAWFFLSPSLGAEFVSHLFPLSHILTCPQGFSFQLFTSCSIMWCLKIKTKTPESPDSIMADLFWICAIDSWAKYKRITKEEDPKGPHAINTCSTKLLSKQTNSFQVPKSHWPLQKSIS